MVDRTKRLTKRQTRLHEKSLRTAGINLNFSLKPIYPLTRNQEKTFDEYEDGNNLFLVGAAGTGKTFLAMYLSLKELLQERSKLEKIVVIRSAQASKAIGFLPGSVDDKISVYEAPYKDICVELFGRGDAWEVLKNKNLVQFVSTSFLRGTTINNAVIIYDEAQNGSYQELRTALTRTGETSKFIIIGDTRQDDLTSVRFNEESGLPLLRKVLNKMEGISSVEFEIEDIVRGGFVRKFLEAEYRTPEVAY